MAGLALGALLHVAGRSDAGDVVWAGTAGLGVVASGGWVLAAARQGRLGVDLLAVVALIGTLATEEYVAGAVITVMLASGRALEARAAARARHDLSALLERAPRVVHRYEAGELTSPDLAVVVPGDRLLVQPGEVVPVDGLIEGEAAVLDESALTGEPLPVERDEGDPVRSGVVNAGGPFDLRATTTADDSTYAGIVRLVAAAEASSAPFVQMADRYASVFLVVGFAVAGAAWFLSGDPVRAVAVLVVATPCPLILAVPVAIISGVSRAAKRGVVIKGGAALEQLAAAEVLLFDKTGTLTLGRPTVAEIVTVDAPGVDDDEVLRLAASLDQMSPHVLAAPWCDAARDRDLRLTMPTDVEERPRRRRPGNRRRAPGRVGDAHWILPVPRTALGPRRRAGGPTSTAPSSPSSRVDGKPVAGAAVRRPHPPGRARDGPRACARTGWNAIVLVTGDRADVAESVGRRSSGVDEVLAEQPRRTRSTSWGEGEPRPLDHGRRRDQRRPRPGAGRCGRRHRRPWGDRLFGGRRRRAHRGPHRPARRCDRHRPAVPGHRPASARSPASACPWWPWAWPPWATSAPAWGALLQELIDVAVILNALRVLKMPGSETRVNTAEEALVHQFSGEHRTLRPDLDQLRVAADQIGVVPPDRALATVREAQRFLVDDLLPHEEAEDAVLYPVFAKVLGGRDPTGTMSRAHVEIAHLVRRIGRLLDEADPADPDPEELLELRRVLYGLHAILELHFAQEDEGYLSLVDEPDDRVE